MINLQSVGAIEGVLRKRINKLHAFNLTAQPLAVVVSKDLSEIEDCFICIDSFKYKLNNPLQLMDTVFKVYHALHADYPPESEAMWLFMQKAIYKFNTKWEFNVPPIVEELTKEYSAFQFQGAVNA